MAERQAFIDRIKDAEKEYRVVISALEVYHQSIVKGSIQLSASIAPRHVISAIDKAESTYLIRMWAEFETALRSYRRFLTGDSEDRIATSNLIDWMACVRQGRAISEDVRDNVHSIRKYRNSLVHERDDTDPPEAISIEIARKQLNTMLHSLPFDW